MHTIWTSYCDYIFIMGRQQMKLNQAAVSNSLHSQFLFHSKKGLKRVICACAVCVSEVVHAAVSFYRMHACSFMRD